MHAAELLPYDLEHDRITVAQAAELAAVTDDVIRQWIRRGHLPVAERDHRGRPRLVPLDVLRAEAKTRHKARRYLTNAA